METATANYVTHAPAVTINKADKVASILQWTYGLLAIAAGADKFAHLLTDWDKYLAPIVTKVIPLTPHVFMNIVGVIEIVAGIIVLAKPKIGSLIVAIWLFALAINLLFLGQYFDVAVRDTVMSIGAFCLFTLLNGKKKAD